MKESHIAGYLHKELFKILINLAEEKNVSGSKGNLPSNTMMNLQIPHNFNVYLRSAKVDPGKGKFNNFEAEISIEMISDPSKSSDAFIDTFVDKLETTIAKDKLFQSIFVSIETDPMPVSYKIIRQIKVTGENNKEHQFFDLVVLFSRLYISAPLINQMIMSQKSGTAIDSNSKYERVLDLDLFVLNKLRSNKIKNLTLALANLDPKMASITDQMNNLDAMNKETASYRRFPDLLLKIYNTYSLKTLNNTRPHFNSNHISFEFEPSVEFVHENIANFIAEMYQENKMFLFPCPYLIDIPFEIMSCDLASHKIIIKIEDLRAHLYNIFCKRTSGIKPAAKSVFYLNKTSIKMKCGDKEVELLDCIVDLQKQLDVENKIKLDKVTETSNAIEAEEFLRARNTEGSNVNPNPQLTDITRDAVENPVQEGPLQDNTENGTEVNNQNNEIQESLIGGSGQGTTAPRYTTTSNADEELGAQNPQTILQTNPQASPSIAQDQSLTDHDKKAKQKEDLDLLSVTDLEISITSSKYVRENIKNIHISIKPFLLCKFSSDFKVIRNQSSKLIKGYLNVNLPKITECLNE